MTPAVVLGVEVAATLPSKASTWDCITVPPPPCRLPLYKGGRPSINLLRLEGEFHAACLTYHHNSPVWEEGGPLLPILLEHNV